MQKNLARLCCALVLTVLFAGCTDTGSGTIAVMDLAEVQSSSTLVVKVAEHLETMRGTLMAEALEAEKTFQENETDETREAYLAAVDNFEQAVAAEEQRIFTTLSDSLDEIMKSYREANGIKAILLKETVLSFDSALDITTEITAEQDRHAFVHVNNIRSIE